MSSTMTRLVLRPPLVMIWMSKTWNDEIMVSTHTNSSVGRKERQRDVPEGVPHVGPIYLSGLVKISGDGLDGGNEDDQVVARPTTDR